VKWLLVGALLALLLVFPQLLALVAAVVAVLSKPVLVAFALGLWARTHLPRMRRWKP
jgi:hypothetical protein